MNNNKNKYQELLEWFSMGRGLHSGYRCVDRDDVKRWREESKGNLFLEVESIDSIDFFEKIYKLHREVGDRERYYLVVKDVSLGKRWRGIFTKELYHLLRDGVRTGIYSNGSREGSLKDYISWRNLISSSLSSEQVPKHIVEKAIKEEEKFIEEHIGCEGILKNFNCKNTAYDLLKEASSLKLNSNKELPFWDKKFKKMGAKFKRKQGKWLRWRCREIINYDYEDFKRLGKEDFLKKHVGVGEISKV